MNIALILQHIGQLDMGFVGGLRNIQLTSGLRHFRTFRSGIGPAGANPSDLLGYGLGLNRFSDPTGKAFGLFYLGASAGVEFVETIRCGRGADCVIKGAKILKRSMATVTPAAELRLVGSANLLLSLLEHVLEDQRAPGSPATHRCLRDCPYRATDTWHGRGDNVASRTMSG